jgi:hypothetical protein
MSNSGKVHPEIKKTKNDWPMITYDQSIHKSAQNTLYQVRVRYNNYLLVWDISTHRTIIQALDSLIRGGKCRHCAFKNNERCWMLQTCTFHLGLISSKILYKRLVRFQAARAIDKDVAQRKWDEFVAQKFG